MPIQAPQWTDFRLCPVCQSDFNEKSKPPISLGCGHSICQSCLFRLSKQQCPFDQAEIKIDIKKLPINYALLSLVGGKIPDLFDVDIDEVKENRIKFDAARKAIEILAESLQNVYITGNSSSNNHNTGNGALTRPMQRKLVTLIHSQLAEEEGRSRAMRSGRSIGERVVKELILMHQSPQTLSAALWAAVRQRGCQFLGPAMQEAVLRLILLSLEDGISLSRKVLVLFVVQKLEKQYTQASKTSIGHVVQLLYRASCFKVTKRDGDSSLLQLHEKYRTYSALRKEHDAQIVQIAMEAGLHISPEQWSALLYGDDEHKSHMQSIIDKLQTPASFASSIQELIIALQRTDDPHDLQSLRSHLDKLSLIDPSPEAEAPTWENLEESMESLLIVVEGLQTYAKDYVSKNKGNIEGAQMINTKYRTSMCRDILQRNTCPRGANCNFAHSEDEVERYRKRRNIPGGKPLTPMNGMYASSRAGSNSSPDSCGTDMEDDFMMEQQKHSPNMNRNLSISIPQGGQFRPYQSTAQDMNSVGNSFKNMNIQAPFSPPVYQSMPSNVQTVKKEEGRDMMKVASNFDVSMSQQVPNRPAPPVYHQVPYVNQQQQQQQQPFFHDMALPTQQSQPMYLPTMANVPNVYQQPAMPPMLSYQDNFQSYGGPINPFNQPFPAANFAMRTATARGGSNEDHNSLLKTASNELSLKIPPLKDSKEDNWKFSANKTTGFDSCIDSGRGSSIGYSSSDTFSPLSNASGGSRSSPQSMQDTETRKIWDDKIWDENGIWAPSGTWSSKPTAKPNTWNNFFESSRHSDPEDRNTSNESVGKAVDHQINKPLVNDSYSSYGKDWPTRSADIINNNHQDFLGLLSPSPTKRAPPPGFQILP